MRLRLLLPSLLALALGTAAWAQSQAPGSINNRRDSRSTSSRAPLKAQKPDPDLLDGSIYEPEKKPLFGMMSEIEMAGAEQKSERVGGNPEPQGAAASALPKLPSGGGPQAQPQQQAAAPPPIPSGQDDRQTPQSQGPQAQAQGVQVANLEVPEGAASAPDQEGKPRDMKIGDATLQIQTVQQSPQQSIVGLESTSTQQYEKKIPQGQQTDNRNRGVEKGKVMPKGI